METKALRYMLYGLLADVALVLAALLLLAASAAASYDGLCGLGIIFGSGRTPCSRGEYVYEAVTFVSFIALFAGWWLIIPLLLLPPLAGLIIGRRKAVGPPSLR
jgi:hypothetical protein